MSSTWGRRLPPPHSRVQGRSPAMKKLAGCKSCNTKSEYHAVESGPGARTVQECQALCEHACTSRHTSASNTQVHATLSLLLVTPRPLAFAPHSIHSLARALCPAVVCCCRQAAEALRIKRQLNSAIKSHNTTSFTAAERKKATKASVSTCFLASRPAAAKFRPATVVGRDFFTAPAKK